MEREKEWGGGKVSTTLEGKNCPEYKKVGDPVILADEGKGGVDASWKIKGFDGKTGDAILERTFPPQAKGEGFRTEERRVSQSDFEMTNFRGSELLVKYFLDKIESVKGKMRNEDCVMLRIEESATGETSVRCDTLDDLDNVLRAFTHGDLQPMHEYLRAEIEGKERSYNSLLGHIKEEEAKLARLKESLRPDPSAFEKKDIELVELILRQTQEKIREEDSEDSEFSRLEELIKILSTEMQKRVRP